MLVGDAFATSCPAAGTGTSKVFTDVERLCNVHIPRWLASDGMGVDKIAAFYDDPVKRACDRHSADKAFNLRSLSIEPGLPGACAAGPASSADLAIGTLRQARAGCRWPIGVAGAAHCRRAIDRADALIAIAAGLLQSAEPSAASKRRCLSAGDLIGLGTRSDP